MYKENVSEKRNKKTEFLLERTLGIYFTRVHIKLGTGTPTHHSTPYWRKLWKIGLVCSICDSRRANVLYPDSLPSVNHALSYVYAVWLNCNHPRTIAGKENQNPTAFPRGTSRIYRPSCASFWRAYMTVPCTCFVSCLHPHTLHIFIFNAWLDTSPDEIWAHFPAITFFL